ncbi:unnamed protein product [Amoebophrya sp. A25]|nr:unnamed protein product [Amoebophrya sp. A25]|eukprot:GSA25T00001088001.1
MVVQLVAIYNAPNPVVVEDGYDEATSDLYCGRPKFLAEYLVNRGLRRLLVIKELDAQEGADLIARFPHKYFQQNVTDHIKQENLTSEQEPIPNAADHNSSPEAEAAGVELRKIPSPSRRRQRYSVPKFSSKLNLEREDVWNPSISKGHANGLLIVRRSCDRMPSECEKIDISGKKGQMIEREQETTCWNATSRRRTSSSTLLRMISEELLTPTSRSKRRRRRTRKTKSQMLRHRGDEAATGSGPPSMPAFLSCGVFGRTTVPFCGSVCGGASSSSSSSSSSGSRGVYFFNRKNSDNKTRRRTHAPPDSDSSWCRSESGAAACISSCSFSSTGKSSWSSTSDRNSVSSVENDASSTARWSSSKPGDEKAEQARRMSERTLSSHLQHRDPSQLSTSPISRTEPKKTMNGNDQWQPRPGGTDKTAPLNSTNKPNSSTPSSSSRTMWQDKHTTPAVTTSSPPVSEIRYNLHRSPIRRNSLLSTCTEARTSCASDAALDLAIYSAQDGIGVSPMTSIASGQLTSQMPILKIADIDEIFRPLDEETQK